MTPGEMIQAHLDAYGLYTCPCGYWTTEPDYMAKHRKSCTFQNMGDSEPYGEQQLKKGT